MDDGTLRHRNEVGQMPTAEISSNAFSKEENKLLIDTLINNFNIPCSLKFDKTRRYFSIYITADGTQTLSKIIAPYIPECMRYKLVKSMDETIPFDAGVWDAHIPSEHVFTTEITTIKPFVDHTNGYHLSGSVYDIEVADNHNFFANGILTHNCQNVPWILNEPTVWTPTEKIDGSSATYTMKRGRWPWSKPEFIVCSRNVPFRTGKESCYYDTNVYLEIAEKYNLRTALSDLMEMMPDEEWITIQGEIYGAGIQKRDYGLKDHRFAAFNLILSSKGRVPTRRMAIDLDEVHIPCVPIIGEDVCFKDWTVDNVLLLSDGNSVIDGGMREGFVYRSADGRQSFKAVSNEYLLKYH